MGTTDSKQKLGERVIAARKKLAEDKKMQSERVKDIKSQSPETIKVIIQSVAESFKSCSPFLEPTLLVAWESNPEECRKIILNSCRRVLNAPINKDEYEWFIKYVFLSSVWMFKTKENRFMYEELIDIANNMQKHIIDCMNSIYNHLQYHPKWKQLLNIENQTIVSRQDDKKVGLLKEKGIQNILEMKQTDDNKSDDDLQTFIDTNLAVNILTSTAKNIDNEFQNHIQTVMSHYGDFKSGPVKKVERCLSKLENDYQDASYPKSAKLLDLVRCSITFNTVDQLANGYNGLMGHISKNKTIIELARVKNGFLDKDYKGGYRDIKVNVIYHSTINPNISMICEVQLLLGQILHEKKRIHKLYSIVRQEEYFRMTVAGDDEKQITSKDVNELKFEPILNVEQQVKGTSNLKKIGKCSVDSDLGLLALESTGISCIDIKKKKSIFSEKRAAGAYNMYSHSWAVIDGQKYFAFQSAPNMIKFFKINQGDNSFTEAKELRICLGENDKIYCCEFDKEFENIIIVKNGNILEKRAVKKSNNVLLSIKLEQKIELTDTKTLSLSNDGNWCVIGGGENLSCFYLIEINKKVQHKVNSRNLKSAVSPCFLNGNPNFCIIGDTNGKIEVWDVKKRVSVKLLELEARQMVTCLTAANNILAVCTIDKKLSLWNTRNWEMFWSEKYEMFPTSVHLTNDSKYLSIGGWSGEKCVVLAIK